MSWKDGSVGRWFGEQHVGKADDRLQHIVEVVCDAAGELADGVHLLALRELLLQLLLLGGLEHIDDRRLAAERSAVRTGFARRRTRGSRKIAFLQSAILDGGDEEAREARSVGKRHVDRRDVALPCRRLADGRLQRHAVALDDGRLDRTRGAIGLRRQHIGEEPGKEPVRTVDPSAPVDGRDRHRRVVEVAREADLGSLLPIGDIAALRAVEHDRARWPERSVAGDRDTVQQPNGQRLTGAALEIEIDHLGPDLSRPAADGGEQRHAVARARFPSA